MSEPGLSGAGERYNFLHRPPLPRGRGDRSRDLNFWLFVAIRGGDGIRSWRPRFHVSRALVLDRIRLRGVVRVPRATSGSHRK